MRTIYMTYKEWRDQVRGGVRLLYLGVKWARYSYKGEEWVVVFTDQVEEKNTPDEWKRE